MIAMLAVRLDRWVPYRSQMFVSTCNGERLDLGKFSSEFVRLRLSQHQFGITDCYAIGFGERLKVPAQTRDGWVRKKVADRYRETQLACHLSNDAGNQ